MSPQQNSCSAQGLPQEIIRARAVPVVMSAENFSQLVNILLMAQDLNAKTAARSQTPRPLGNTALVKAELFAHSWSARRNHDL